MFKGLDHVAILVSNTDEALAVYRDRMGLPVLYSEVVNGGAIRLTHLDLGNTQLQLVEPLSQDHPLALHLKEHGSGLHHLCFAVDNVDDGLAAAVSLGMAGAQAQPHQGTQGKRAAFLLKSATADVQIEITGE